MYIDNNNIAPVPTEQKRSYNLNGKQFVPNYVTIVAGEWYMPQAIAARKTQGLNVTPD